MTAKGIRFLQSTIWDMRLADLPFPKAVLVRGVRIIVMAVEKFRADHCQRNASILTYYSLLNIVPLFAVVFAIAKGFGLEKLVVRQIVQLARNADWQVDVTARMIQFSRSLLFHAKGEVIVGVGIVILFWTVISILAGSKTASTPYGRPGSRVRSRVSLRLPVHDGPRPHPLRCLEQHERARRGRGEGFMSDVSFIGPITLFMIKILPYLSIWMLLLILYLVMPNPRVPLRSTVTAAFVSGTFIQAAQWIYIRFQIGVSTQSAIYGSFAAIPLFLAWLQVSWIIVLLGAEIAYAAENQETCGFHPDYSRIGEAGRRLLMLRIFHLLVKRFEAGQRPLAAGQISKALKIPERFTRRILADLVEVDLVSEITRGPRKESYFQPARAIADMTITQALNTYEKNDTGEPVREDDKLALFPEDPPRKHGKNSPAQCEVKEM
jgi:membrane protein